MSLRDLVLQLESRTDRAEWSAFLEYADTFFGELGGSRESKNSTTDERDASQVLLHDYIGNAESSLFARYVATEFVSFLRLSLNDLERVIAALYERRQQASEKSVAASLAASLVHPVTANVGAVAARNEMGRDTYRNVFGRFVETDAYFRGLVEDITSVSTAPSQPPVYLAGYRTIGNLKPGDCLFRRQTTSLLGNPFRDFGHTGIYLGCDSIGANVGDCINHKVVHVVNAIPACQLTSLQEFCNPKGVREQFWGAYQVRISNKERRAVVSKALASVGKYVYGYIHYKGPKKFRCDGFVEFCYESAVPTSPPLEHRKGLFEDDLWKTISPAALRNCFTEKILDVPICCTTNS